MIWMVAAPAYNPDDVKPGWIALGLVALLAVATYLLWRSMNTRLKRINVPTNAEARQARRELDAARSADLRDGPVVEPGDTDSGDFDRQGDPGDDPDPGHRP